MTDEFTSGSPANRTRGDAPDLRVVPDDGPAPGLEIPETLDHGAWRTIGLGLARERRASDLEWRLGDWAAQADGRFATLAEAAAIADESLSNIKKYVATAKAFPSVRRRTGVAFFLHSEVAALPEEEGESLLDQAAAAHWTRGEMREAVREVRQRMHAEQVAQLEARLRKLSDENEQLHREKAPETAEEKARDAVRQTLTRMKAEGRVVNDAVRRTATMFMGLGDKKVAGSLHGNRRSGLARDSARAFAALSAQTRNARADVAHTIGLIAKDGKSPAEASVTALLDEIEEAMREITRRLDAAELNPAQAKAVSDAFNARMDALKTIVTGDVHEALNRKLNGEC